MASNTDNVSIWWRHLYCCRDACHISKRYGHSNSQSLGCNIQFRFSALPIYRGLFSPNNSQETPIARPLGRDVCVVRDISVWPKFTCEFNVLRSMSCYTVPRYIELKSYTTPIQPAVWTIIVKYYRKTRDNCLDWHDDFHWNITHLSVKNTKRAWDPLVIQYFRPKMHCALANTIYFTLMDVEYLKFYEY